MMQSNTIEEEEESADEKPVSVHHLLELISSLISLSNSINVFTLKWQLISHKLEELLSSLSAMENSASDDPLLHTTLQTIAATLEDCHGLASQCACQSFAGNLLMKSNLDIVSKKLENHVKSLCEIYNLGLLTHHSYALVVSRPNLSASRDDIKFYLMDLFSRLKIGTLDMKKEAFFALNEFFQDNEKYVKIAVEVDSLVYLLVDFLDSPEGEIQEEAAKAVSLISGYASCKCALIGTGVISALVRVLECGSELSKEFTARCLQKLTENSDNAWSVSAHGGVTSLLKICSNGDHGGGLISSSCGVLKNLIGVEEIKRFVIDEDAIPLFIRLVKSKDDATQLSSIDFLQAIPSGDESIRKRIVSEGGVHALIHVLDAKASSSSKAKEMALRGVMSLCSPNDQSMDMLISCRFIDHTLYILRYGENSVQEMGLKAACWLCGISEDANRAMGDKGFISELVGFLGSKSCVLREMASEAICRMIEIPRNRKRFLQSDENVVLLLQMLDIEEASSGNNRKCLLSILMTLSRRSHRVRKKIINSGYLKNIEKLADAEITEAKHIIKKLSSTRSRFSSMLTKIWHT